MPSGVGAPLRAARIVIAASLAAASIAILATPAHAQAAPPTGGIVINKTEIGGTAPATFEVTGPDITGTATLLANVVAENTPTPALPPLPLLIPGTYTITETAPVDENGQSVWELTSVVCDGEEIPVQGNSVQVVVADAVISCTFTDTVTRSEILGLKVVTGDTSTWTRPAQFHITCPDLGLDIDIEPPVGPGGPGTYVIGQGTIPPATCTISETDTGSDGFVQVSMIVIDDGILVATGTTSVTFTSVAGGDLVIRVTNAFAFPERPEQPAPTTTTVAGGSTTTTTTIATTTTATTVPNGGTTTTPGGGQSSSAPTSTPSELPTTGSPTGGLLVAALLAMLGGLVLVARTRRLVD